MKSTERPRRRRKRRNCYYRLRAMLLNARCGRRPDPATSAAMQLLSVFTVIFGRMPNLVSTPIYVPYSPPPPSHAFNENSELARRIGVPRRYLDVVVSLGQVPYSILFDHLLQGGALRRDALIELRKRIPAASLDWFDHVQRSGHWSDLIRCYSPNAFDEDTDIRLLKSALTWLDQSSRNNDGPDGPNGPT